MVKQCYYQNVQYVIVKNQEAEGLLSSLGVRTPLSKSLLKSRAWRVCVLTCLACLSACLFASLRAWRAYVFACLHAWRAYVLGVLACLRACYACMFMCVLVMMKCFIFLRVCVLGVLFCLICFTFQYLNLKILTAKKLCALLTSRKNTFYIIRKIEVRNVTGDVVMWFLQKVVFV